MIPALRYLQSSHYAIIAYSKTKKFKKTPASKQAKYIPYDVINPSELANMIKYAEAGALFPFCHRNRLRRALNTGRLEWSWHPIKNSIVLYRGDLERLNYEQLTYFTQKLPQAAISSLTLTKLAIETLKAYRADNHIAARDDWKNDSVDLLIEINNDFEKDLNLSKNDQRLLKQFKEGLKGWLKL